MISEIPQSQEDLQQHFRDSLRFLEDSSKSYDDGFEGESKRLAATIRTLVHDTSRSKSLLTHLGTKEVLFIDSAYANFPDNTMSYCGLVAMHMGTGAAPRYIALLDSAKTKPVPFDAWWDGVIFDDGRKNTITRKELILSIANKDGGSHVDEKLDEKYGNLSRNNSMGWRISQDGQDLGPMRAPEKASVRQIAHEVLKTLKPGYEKSHPKIGGFTISGIGHSPRISVPEPPQDETPLLSLGAPCHCGSHRKYKKCHGRVFKAD